MTELESLRQKVAELEEMNAKLYRDNSKLYNTQVQLKNLMIELKKEIEGLPIYYHLKDPKVVIDEAIDEVTRQRSLYAGKLEGEENGI